MIFPNIFLIIYPYAHLGLSLALKECAITLKQRLAVEISYYIVILTKDSNTLENISIYGF